MDSMTPVSGSQQAAAAPSAPNAGDSAAEAQAMEGIRALDPGFSRFEDLHTMPEAGAFNSLVLKGHSLTDAFRLARFDALVGQRASEAGKNALSRAYNRSHLSATAVNGTQAPAVPAETLEMYRLMQPGLRDEDYRAHYLRHNAKR